jgi:hypothetical protein
MLKGTTLKTQMSGGDGNKMGYSVTIVALNIWGKFQAALQSSQLEQHIDSDRLKDTGHQDPR